MPSRLVLLEQDLGEQLGAKLKNATLELTQYRVHTNEEVVFRYLTAGITAGATGGVLASGFGPAPGRPMKGSSCARGDMRGGWYAGSEITAQRSPLIFEIAVRWNGKPLSMRKVYTPKRYFTAAFDNADHAATLFDAIREAHADLAKQIADAP